MKKLFILTALCGAVAGLAAQSSLDLLTLSGRYGFPSKYEESAMLERETETGAMVNVKLPVKFSGSSIWYNDLTYNTFHVNSVNDFTTGIAHPIHLHAFILQTGWYKRFGEGQGIQLLLAPRFMTDFENVSGKNFQLGGIAMYEKRFSERLMLRFGAMYNDELGGPFVVPIVYSDWQINSRWSLVGMWPIFGKLSCRVNENFSAGISHFGLITSYFLGNPDYQGDYIERTSIDLCGFARVRLAGNVHMEGRLGYAVGRSYYQYGADQKVPFRISIIKFGDNRVEKNTTFKPGPILELRLVYNLLLE